MRSFSLGCLKVVLYILVPLLPCYLSTQTHLYTNSKGNVCMWNLGGSSVLWWDTAPFIHSVTFPSWPPSIKPKQLLVFFTCQDNKIWSHLCCSGHFRQTIGHRVLVLRSGHHALLLFPHGAAIFLLTLVMVLSWGNLCMFSFFSPSSLNPFCMFLL